MNESDRRSAQGALDWIAEHWPALAALIPPGCPLFNLGFGVGKGCCTEPAALKGEWFPSLGGEVFAFDRDVPDPFFACGIQNRGGSEYLFAMRREGPRRFWFYDQYVVFYAQTDASPERTAESLATALEFWDKGGETVVFSGPWGWFDPSRREFGGLNEIQKALYKINRDLDPLPPQEAKASGPGPRDPAEEGAAKAKRSEATAPADGRRVLVVYPAGIVGEFVCWLMEKEGYRAAQACTGVEALERLGVEPAKPGVPLPDIIVAQLQLPGMDGLALAGRLLSDAATAAIPIVLNSSGSSDAGQPPATRLFNVKAILGPPLDPEQLLETISKILLSSGGNLVPAGKYRVLVTCSFMSPYCGPDETRVCGDFESLDAALAYVEDCVRRPSIGPACFRYEVLNDRGDIVASR